MTCNNVLPQYFAYQFLRRLARTSKDGEAVVYEAMVPGVCHTTFRVGSSIGSQRPGLARAIVRHVHHDPHQTEDRVMTAVKMLRVSGVPIDYTSIVGLGIDVLDWDSLMQYSEAEQRVADSLIHGLIFGIHDPEEAQRDITQDMDEFRAGEPEWRKAGLKLPRRGLRTAEEWNRWALKLVDVWQRQHGISLPLQEVAAVFEERSDLVDAQLDELKDVSERGREGFLKVAFRSRRFSANLAFLGEAKACPEVWWAVGRSCSLGFCLGAGWLHEDVAIEYVRYLATLGKRSIASAKSQKVGRLLAFLSFPLPDSKTFERAYLASMWEGARFGAEKHNRPESAARAERESGRVLNYS